ncbi:MAG: MFS transporter [Proteobacteria bacterium]|nr:MFS transporter [Pseudomonadota bacterium]
MSADATAAAPPMGALRRIRSLLGGSAGNLVEWYDWYAYAAFGLYFSKIIFPPGSATKQLLDTALVFGLGFFARPLGAWLMGVYADRAGRKASLTLSVALMCLGSLLIAVCPGFKDVGYAAPALLLGARLIQGISLGGEYGTSSTYLSEMAGRKHRGMWSSLQYMTLISGQLIALGVLIVLQRTMAKPDLDAWGWRIPFVIGALLALSVFWLRRNIDETGSYRAVENRERGKTLWLVLRHPRESLTVLGLTAGGTLAFYCYTIYMQKFLANTAGFSKDQASEISALSLLIMMVVQPFYGWLSDKIGRRAMLIGFGVMGVVGTWPILSTLSHTHDWNTAFALVVASVLIVSCYTSINAVVKAEMFPTEIRALGVALPYAISNALFGGTAEYVALWCKDQGHEPWFYIYVTVVIGASLLVYLWMKDTRTHSRIVED